LIAQAVCVLDGTLLELLNASRKHIHENDLKEMDLAGGTLSYEGIHVFRRVKTGGIKRFRGSMIPSKSEIKQMTGILVEWFARPFCLYTLKLTSMGEAVEIDYCKTMRFILRAFH
jgi:hypothetical protein